MKEYRSPLRIKDIPSYERLVSAFSKALGDFLASLLRSLVCTAIVVAIYWYILGGAPLFVLLAISLAFAALPVIKLIGDFGYIVADGGEGKRFGEWGEGFSYVKEQIVKGTIRLVICGVSLGIAWIFVPAAILEKPIAQLTLIDVLSLGLGALFAYGGLFVLVKRD